MSAPAAPPPTATVLRPEPGNAATRARLADAGIEPVALPLFAPRPLAWSPPDPADHDALLLTSANAARLGGERLATLAHLPVLAVGEATAAAARAAGLAVALTGDRDAASLLAAAPFRRPLHLAGRDHHPTGAATIAVYAAEPLPIAATDLAAALARSDVALLHSPRAARRFAALVDDAALPRDEIAIAALSPAVLAAAGPGWRWTAASPHPDDAALVALVRARLTACPPMRISGA